jgi:tetratricopeptide (TPR) repeat protein
MAKQKNPATSRSSTKHTRQSTKKISDRTIALLLALFAFLLYVNTLHHGYVLDDNLAIADNPNVTKGISGIPHIFTQPYRENCFGGCLYRPVTLSTFAIEWSMAPRKPLIGHWMNVLWYAATAFLLFLTLRRLLPNRNSWLPIIASVLFIAHPVHTEVVANIKSRDEILSLFFIVLSLFHFSKWHSAGHWRYVVFAGLAYLAALLSKEGAITMLVVFPFIGWIFFQKTFLSSLKNSRWALIPLVVFFALRGFALTGLTEPEIHMIDNPIVEAQGLEKIGTSMIVLWKYLWLLVFPLKLVNDYSYNVIPLQSLFSVPAFISFLLYTVITIFAVYGLLKRKIAGFFAFAFLSSIILYSQLLVVIGTMMGERLAYTPSLWFVLAIAVFIFDLIKSESFSLSKWKLQPVTNRMTLAAFAVITLLFSIRTIMRNGDWANDLLLAQTDVKKSPNSVRLHDHVSEEMYKSTFDESLTAEQIDERLKVAEEHARKSLAIKPGLLGYNNLGNVNFTRKNFAEAISYYQKTKEILPGYAIADQNTVYTLLVWAREESEKKNNPQRALELLQQALTYNPNDPDVLQVQGQVLFKLGRKEEALASFEKAHSLAPDNSKIKNDLRDAYLLMGLTEKAEGLR